jgi:hypothetical protein
MKLYDKAFNTEGVLILASAEALKTYFSNNEFDYTFPKGILPLVLDKKVFAMVTEETVDKLTIYDERAEVEQCLSSGKWEDLKVKFYLTIESNDKLLLLSHADFTQICDWHKGEYTQHRLFDKKWILNGVSTGEYQIECVRKKHDGKCILLMSLAKLADNKQISHNSFSLPTVQAWYK